MIGHERKSEFKGFCGEDCKKKTLDIPSLRVYHDASQIFSKIIFEILMSIYNI